MDLSQTEKRATNEPYYDLSNFGRQVSTNSREAQIWFNRGLTWAYSFNHEEAIKCFEQTIAHNPECAMGYWGLAYASGPNYNKTWGIFDERDLRASVQKCYELSREALRHLDNASPVEQALVKALQSRFPADRTDINFTLTERAYATAMRPVYQQLGENDLDVIALFADALMNSAPRKMFDAKPGRPIASSPVFEARATLEHGLSLSGVQFHPGVPHLYIHLMEMSDEPQTALPASDLIRDMIPDAGHMYHMPTHLDVLVGAYQRSIDCNTRATYADDKFFARDGGVNFYSYYRLHNYHSLIYAAMLAAQSKVALEAADRMEATISEELLRVEVPPLANWMEFFLAVRVHILIRFGMWEELKRLPIPEDNNIYCTTIVMRHYGHGIAYAATGDIEEAEKARQLFWAAAKRVPPTRLDFPNRIVDILKVAGAMLDGEIQYRKSNFESAFERLREAIAYDDALHYTEPWGWMLPTRHAYAALSLEQGLVEQTAKAYAEDLGFDRTITRMHQHPKNVWALHGYHECLLRLGRKDEARALEGELVAAQALADVPVHSSCFCRLGSLPTRKLGGGSQNQNEEPTCAC